MMAVKLEKKLLRTIANRKMLGKDREFCLSLHPQLSIALQRLSGIIILWNRNEYHWWADNTLCPSFWLPLFSFCGDLPMPFWMYWTSTFKRYWISRRHIRPLYRWRCIWDTSYGHSCRIFHQSLRIPPGCGIRSVALRRRFAPLYPRAALSAF